MNKSQQLADDLRNLIRSGRFLPGERLPGEYELQAEFGVSRTTVRDALSSLAAEGLIIRKRSVGNFVSERPAGACVAIAVDANQLSSLMGYWYRVLVEEAQENIIASGYKPILVVGNGRTNEDYLASVNLPDTEGNDGVCGVLDVSSRRALSQHYRKKGIPCVDLEAAVATSTYSIVVDYANLVRNATKMMGASGHADFALMHYEFDEELMQYPVYQEFVRLREAAVGFNKDRIVTVPGHPDPGAAYEVFKDWWSRKDRPNSMFFFDDSLFDIASRAISELRIKVPEDLAILTHANVGRSFYFPTRVARIGFDPAAVIKAGWTILNDLITGQPVFEPSVLVPPVFVDGDSLGNAAKSPEDSQAKQVRK